MTMEQANTNQAWQARKEAAIARGLKIVAPAYIDRARGSELWDVEGKRYIDFASGIAVCNTGHMHPAVTQAVLSQLERFSHTCMILNLYDSAVVLAEQLNQLAPGATPKKTICVTTGAEAVETSIKLARAYTGRRGVIAFNGAFHGRTNLTMGLTGRMTPYKNVFGPFPAEIYHTPFPMAYHGIAEADALTAINNLFMVDIAASDVAAIIIEPVQGEGGFYPAPNSFLKALRGLCDEHGIVLIADEVQTGFARTGKFFASEYADIEPDLITVGKGLAGGYPLAAVVGKTEIMDAPLPGSMGGTYAGSPLACAAALAVIEVIEQENLLGAANNIALIFDKFLIGLQEKYPAEIGDIRTSRGAMIAIELVQGGDARQPNPELAKAIVDQAHNKGLLLLTCGMHGNIIRFLPALNISEELIGEGLTVLQDCFDSLL